MSQEIASLHAKIGVDIGAAMGGLTALKTRMAEAGVMSQTLQTRANGVSQATSGFRNRLLDATGWLKSLRDQGNITGNGLTVGLGGALKGAGSALTGLGETAVKTGGMIATALGVGSTAAIGVLGIKTLADYDKQMSILGVTSGATSIEMEAASAAIKTLATDMTVNVFSAAEMAEALKTLGQAGMTATEATTALRPALLLAAAGGLEASEGAAALASTLKMFHLPASDAAVVVDRLAAASMAGGMSVKDMLAAVGQAGTAFASAGIPMSEMLTGLALFGASGIKGAEAGTLLTGVLNSLKNASPEATAKLAAIGVQAYNANGTFRPLGDTLRDLTARMLTLTPAQRELFMGQIFGQQAGEKLWNALQTNGVASWDIYKAKIDQSGAAALLASGQNDNLAGAFTRLQKAIQNAAMDVLEPWKDTIKGWTDAALGWILSFKGLDWPGVQTKLKADIGTLGERILGWIGDQIGPFGSKLLEWAKAFGAWIAPKVPGILVALGELAGSVLTWIGEQIPAIVAQLQIWGAAFIAWIEPQIPGMLKALGELASQFWTWLETQLPLIGAQLVTWGEKFVAWVEPQIPGLLTALGELATKFFAWIKGKTPAIVAQLLEWADEFLAWVIPMIPGFLVKIALISLELFKWIASIPAKIGEHIAQKWIPEFLKWVAELLPQIPGKLGEIATALFKEIVAISNVIFEKAKEIGTRIIDGIVAGLANLGSIVGNAITSRMPGLPSLPGVGGGSTTTTPPAAPSGPVDPRLNGMNPNDYRVVDMPGGGYSIQRRAMGGPVAAGQTYMVGERGPELLTMGGSGGHVTSNASMNGDKGVTITNLNLYGNYYPGDIQQLLRRELDAINRRGGPTT